MLVGSLLLWALCCAVATAQLVNNRMNVNWYLSNPSILRLFVELELSGVDKEYRFQAPGKVAFVEARSIPDTEIKIKSDTKG
jgi:hypothetical protein